MDFLTYVQKLKHELAVNRLPEDKIRAIIQQESALAETKESADLPSFFTPDRIEVVLAQAKMQHGDYFNETETKTIIPQRSGSNNAVRILDEEKTILPTTPKTTLHSLTDEVTMVVISSNHNDASEETTIAASPDLKKILSENETVRISEKDTVFFQNTSTIPSTPSNEDETVPHIRLTPKKEPLPDTDVTRPVRHAVTITEQTQPISSPITKSTQEFEKKTVADQEKKEGPQPKASKNETVSSVHPLSPETLRNPHPHISFLWIAFLLIPSICFLAVLIALCIIVIDLLFLIVFTLTMGFYLSVLVIPLLFIIYSVVFSFLYWNDFRISDGFTEFGITLFLSGASLMLSYLFYHPFINTTELLVEKFKSFNQKTFRLLRNLYRYSVKGAEKL